jgi:hypothetical protein
MAEEQEFLTEDQEFEAAYLARAKQDAGGADGGADDDTGGAGDGQDGHDDSGHDDDDQGGDGGGDDGGDGGEGGEQGGGDQDDLETLKKRAHSYDSLKGRHQQVQDENRALKEELARLKQAPAPEQLADDDVPADLRDDLEVIAGLDPDLAELVREKSADGERLRKSLAKFGPESTAAMADSLRTRRYVEGQHQAQHVAQVLEKQKTHYADLLSAVPSLSECAVVAQNAEGHYQLFANPDREADFNAYFKGLGEWLDELPHKTAKAYGEIVWKNGGPREVADVLKEYDKARKPREHVDKELADDLAPVRSRSRGPGGGIGDDPNSFEGAFNRRVKQENKRA